MNKRMVVSYALSLFAAGAAVAVEPTSVTTNGVTVVVSNVTDGAVYTGTCRKEDGISSLALWTMGHMYYKPEGVPTHEGGTEIRRAQVRVKSAGIFGSGDIRLGTWIGTSTGLLFDGVDVDLTNKVVFGVHGCYVSAYGDGACVRLRSVGTDNEYHSVRFGRETAGSHSRAVLSLDPSTSDPLSRMELSGLLDLNLDGGVIKFRSYAENPFFRRIHKSDQPTVVVTENGVGFDAEDGADVRFGISLQHEIYDDVEVLETYVPANAGFESKLSDGWTVAAENGETSEIRSNGSAFDTNGGVSWHTPEGGKYLMLRNGATLSCKVDIPADGLWRVAFLRGCRPPESGTYSKGISTDILVDGDVKHTFAPLLPGENQYPFTEFFTSAFDLSAGEHDFAISNGTSEKNRHFNYDRIVFQRVKLTRRQGKIRKTGMGKVQLEGSRAVGMPVEVSAGTLFFDDATFTNSEISVASGATNAFFDCAFDGGNRLFVAEGGTLSFAGNGVNFVNNGRFEADGKLMYSQQVPKYWTISCDSGVNETSGIQSGGGTLTPSGPYSPFGDSTIYLREGFSAATTVDCPRDGDYEISFVVACRKYEKSHLLPVLLKLDGETVGEIPAQNAYYGYTRHRFIARGVAAGERELRLVVPQGERRLAQGSILFFDDVSMRRHLSADKSFSGEIRFEGGSCLDLGFEGVLSAEAVYVDGVPFSGGKSALRRAGVAVSGPGRLRVGPASGFVIFMK